MSKASSNSRKENDEGRLGTERPQPNVKLSRVARSGTLLTGVRFRIVLMLSGPFLVSRTGNAGLTVSRVKVLKFR